MEPDIRILSRGNGSVRIPDGWRVTRLGDLVDRARPITYGVVKPGDPDPNGVQFIRGGDIHHGRISKSLRTITRTVSDQYRRTLLRGGEIVVALVGFPGQSAIVPPRLAGANLARQAGLVAIPDKRMTRYVHQFIQSDVGQDILLHPLAGSAQQVINLVDLRKMPVILPPDDVRERITEFAELCDQRAELCARQASRVQKRLRGLMQQLLTGRRRLPAFASRETKHDLILGGVPADWEVVPVSDVAKRVTRRNNAGETHVLTASGQHGLVDQREFFNRSVAGEDLSTYYLLKRGEFAYNRSRMKGYTYGAIKRLDRYPQGAISTLYLCFAIADKRVDSDFLRWYCEGGKMNRQLFRVTPVGGRAHGLLNLTSDDFFSIRITLPPLREQRAIADVLDMAQREIDLLKQLRDQIQQQKRGLMQKLLTGQIPVPKEAHA